VPRLYNGTRLVIKNIVGNVIDATILNGKFGGENILLLLLPTTFTDALFQFKGSQFPIRLALG